MKVKICDAICEHGYRCQSTHPNDNEKYCHDHFLNERIFHSWPEWDTNIYVTEEKNKCKIIERRFFSKEIKK
jgi:hypothetical protein